MPPALRTRPYKDFLTPALHRRFVNAMAVLGFLCYAESLLIGYYNGWFWTWFPFGRAGIRAGLLFISAFSLFILRVAQLHVGYRTTSSPFATFKEYAFRFQTAQTACWYAFSAWLFCEIYIFSASETSNIRWITSGATYDRPRLNERPIYLMSYFLLLALTQTGVHLFFDYDRVDMPVVKTRPEGSLDQGVHVVAPPLTQIWDNLWKMLASAFCRSLAMTIATPWIYSMFIRESAWSWTISVAKIFWNLPKSTALPAKYPFHVKILTKTLTGGTLLILLWEFANVAFSAYVAQEPLKNGRPITHESRDPNGSLLTGLNGKKLQTRAFAFWELLHITQQFQGRRKIIYEDIDRKGGSAWSQISAACLEVITGIDKRIMEYQNPQAAKPVASVHEPIPSLPRIAQPPNDGNIFSAAPAPGTASGSAAHTIGEIARRHGQSTGPGLLHQAKEVLLDPKHQQKVAPNGFQALVQDYASVALKTIAGWPFRQTFRRRIACIVLGTPNGDVGIIVDAIESLTRLSVCSLTEDRYGNVQRDVRQLIRTLTNSITRLQHFKNTLNFHWTDVERKRESPEVDMILTTLRRGLGELLDAFGDYTADLRLSQSDVRYAREAAAVPEATTPTLEKGPEMKQYA